MEVDLFTHNAELEGIMLEGFSGKIIEEQYRVDKAEIPHLYCFYNLNLQTLQEFLRNRNFEYEIRDSKTGKIVSIVLAQPAHNLN